VNRLAFSIGDAFLGNSAPSALKNPSGVSEIVSIFLNIAFILAGLTLLIFFIIGGIGLISSAGQSDPGKAEQSKKTITSAVIGFVIVFASYWIVKLIGQLIGIPNII
jgi:hypothetical protein